MSTGFVLNIDDKLLKNLEKADELVQDIGKHSEQTRDMFNNAFQSMATGSLDGFISKLMSARQAIQDIGDAKVSDKGFGSISTQAVQGADSVNNLVESITRLMQVAQGREKVQPIDINSIDIAEDNIESLREKIATLKRLLSQNRQGLIDETQQQNAKLLLDEINRLQVAYGNLRTEQKNLQSFDKVFSLSEETISQTEKKLAKMRELWSNLYKDPQKYEEELKKVTAEIQRLIKRKSDLKKLTTFEGAMDFSKSTKSIKDQIQAIKYLKAARENLSKEGMSEADYRKKVKELTDEIKRQQKEVDKLVGKNSDLGKSHKSLINTADQLKRAFALVFSVSAIKGYVTQIARVRGEFELQQRSLQAILQNKDEADRLWRQTIQLAVRSPFQVKELVTYTKQLAAYRVESDKLYDTTKMLADVSAGLGVDMNRLILAYGQVKAANYLRGTELRQFSEAGVNILAELAKYFTELEGRAVSVGDVFERVSKRMVTFADVEEIFKRITSEGGVFYNMQEVQAETLKGQISNLRDAIDIMLNEIGQKNEHILKSVVGVVRTVVQNWEVLVPILKAVVAGFALTRVNALLAKESIMLMAIDLGVLVNAEQEALTVTQLLNVGWKSFIKNLKAAGTAAKAFVVSNPIFAALTAILYVLVKVGSAWMEHKREIDEINKKYQDLGTTIKSISNKFSFAQAENSTDNLKRELNQLIELANREYNMGIKVDVSGLNAEQLANKFTEIRDKIFNAQEVAKTFELAMQKTASWKPDSIDIYGDLEGTEEKVLEQYSVFRKVATHTVFEMNKIQDKLTQTQLDALKKLQEPQQVNETQFQYVERLRLAYISLMSTYLKYRNSAEISDTNRAQLLQQEANILSKMGIPASALADMFQSWGVSLSNTQEEFDKVFDELDKEIPQFLNGEGKEYYIKTAIDKKGFTDIQRELAYFFANQRYGINITPTIPISNKKDKATPTGDDKQNKLTSKRISLIKEMRREYEQLNKTFDKTTSKEKVIASYTNAVNEAFKGTGISIDDIKFDSLEALAESLESLKDLAAKEGTEAKLALEKAISGIRVQIGVETKQGEDKKLKQQVEDLFSRYDITLNLEKLGLSKDLMESLFDVEYLDLDSLKSKLEELKPQFKGDEMDDEYEQYVDRINKLSKKEQEQQARDFVKFLTKKLDETTVLMQKSGGYLSYAKKLLDEGKITAEQYSEVVNEVIKETNEGISKVNLNLFKDSDTYIKAMGSLAGYTADELKMLRESLQAVIADNSKAFSADEITAYYDAIARIAEQEQKLRTPWEKTGFAEIGYLNEQYKERERLISEESRLEQNKQTLIQQRINLEQELADATETGEDTDWITEQLNSVIEELGIVDSKIKKNAAALALVNGNIEKFSNGLGVAWTKVAIGIAQVNNIAQGIKDSFNEIKDVAASFGVDTENESWTKAGIVIESFAGATENATNAIQSFISGDIGGTLKGLVGFVGSIIKGFNQFHDAKYDAIIKTEQKNVEKLAKAYDRLEKHIADAMDVTQLQRSSNAARENLEKQIESTQKMINAEKDKKDTDEEAVEEYKTNLDELNEKLKELEAERVKSLGGFGDVDAMKNATEEFVDVWMEAYKETGNGLDALEGKFNEFLENTIKKQIVMRGANNILKGLYENYDAMFSEDSVGGAMLTPDEADAIRKLWEQSKQQLNNYLLNISKSLGVTTGEADGELSGLQAGIQGITESQAEIISAYLNSIRFFVSDNNSVMKQLRDYVVGTDDTANPMLAQLRIIAQQTSAMRTLLDSVTQSGHPKGQSGIRVFID